jgi:8-oxo-dGTP diphosphatase
LEFPGGKIEHGETPKAAAKREVLEEVGVVIPEEASVLMFKYQSYETELKNICLFVFLSNFTELPYDKGQWLSINFNQKSAYLEGKIPPINHVILDDLAVYLQSQYNAGMIGSLWQI